MRTAGKENGRHTPGLRRRARRIQGRGIRPGLRGREDDGRQRTAFDDSDAARGSHLREIRSRPGPGLPPHPLVSQQDLHRHRHRIRSAGRPAERGRQGAQILPGRGPRRAERMAQGAERQRLAYDVQRHQEGLPLPHRSPPHQVPGGLHPGGAVHLRTRQRVQIQFLQHLPPFRDHHQGHREETGGVPR